MAEAVAMDEAVPATTAPMDAPPSPKPSSEQPPAQSPEAHFPGPTLAKEKQPENDEEEDAEEARRTQRSQRWGTERVVAIKPKEPKAESREQGRAGKRERATGEKAEEVSGSTLEGGRRRCDKCRKTFAERDMASFRKHICGRAPGGARTEAEQAQRLKERKERSGTKEGEEEEEEGEEGEGEGRRAKKPRASAEGKDAEEGDDEPWSEARKAARREERDRERKEKPLREGPPPQEEGSRLVTVKGREMRECKACCKTFAPFDVNSFKKHVCGRKAGERGGEATRAAMGRRAQFL